MSQPISKTDYILYRECAKNTWIKIHKPDIYYKKELSEFEQHIIDTGNEVELVARELYPTGILIQGRDEKAQKLTAEYIEKKEATLFQPVFQIEDFLAAVDILKYNSEKNGYEIFEVKASNEIDEKIHFYDLAFQVILLRKCELNIVGINLIHLNKEYIRKGDLDIIKLFNIANVDEEIKSTIDEVGEEIEKAKKYLFQENEPTGPCSCIYKGRSKHCTTFSYSNRNIPEYGVHDIARIGSSKKKLKEMIDGNIFHLHEIPEHIELSEIQKNQVDAHVLDRITIKKDKIAEEFRSLQYPLYFLDYETFPSALPMFDGFSPYQQIPFQYSLHIINSPEAEPEHFEFLHTEKGDPSMNFYKSLQKNIGKIGTVIVWNKKFESMINRELSKRIPESTEFMLDINSRIFDLMEIFSKQYYVHKDFLGSFSIKYVLPVLVPELSYKDLVIKEGGTASKSWYSIVNGHYNASESEETAKALKDYCKLDTYAMYAVWRKLYNTI